MALTELERWELTLKKALDEVDVSLEQQFASRLRPHPRRPPAGTTGNPRYDGAVAVNSTFSLGLVSGDGPGYVIEIRLSTADNVSAELQQEILQAAEPLLKRAITAAFPQRKLVLERQRDRFRLTGDLTLS